MSTLYNKNSGGYIALISAIIISFILFSLTLTVSASGFFSRANVSNLEYKRISLGLAESCANTALLKVAQNFFYVPPVSGEVVAVGSESCIIKTASSTASDATGRKLVYITTQAQYRGAWSNMKVTASAQDPSFTTLSHGTLIVYTHVINDNGGTSVASNFSITIGATANPSPATFAGQESGTSVLVDAGSTITVGVVGPSGYGQTPSGCSGVITAGATQTCVITEDDIPNTATLTLIANVKNDNSGTLLPSSIPLFLDGTLVSVGIPVTLVPGTHKATSAKVSGYATSTWGYQCPAPGDGNITLNKGDNKTCVVVYDDIPPPAPACVDTVLMLSGHMNGVGALAAEAAAVKSFIQLTASSSPTSLVGVGSYGGYDNSAAAIPLSGVLTSSYGINAYATTTTIKYPTANGTPNLWKTAANAYVNDTLFATSSTNGAQQTYEKFGINLPANAQITGIEIVASDKVSLSSGSPKLDLALSWNNGTSMTASKSISLTTTEASSTLGNSTDTWGRAWTPTEMSDANFSVILKHNSTNGRIISLNYVNLKIYYSVPSTGLYSAIDTISSTINSSFGNDVSAAISIASTELNSARHRPACNRVLVLATDGSNNTAGKTSALNSADAAKLSGIEIYTVHFGNPPSARDFVASIASGTTPVAGHQPGSFDDTSNSQRQSVIDAENADGDHFFISPDPSQFSVIFNQIGTIVFAGIGTPPPAPTRATLIVTTHVINDNGGPALPADFLVTISPSLNASPISPFAGVDLPGVTVTVDPGSYVVSESNSFSGYTETDGFGCSGVISAGDIISCTITNDDVIPPPPLPPPPPPEIGIGPWEEATSTAP